MKIYLLCSLNDEDYMDPEFEFFKYFEDAHRCIKETIAESIMNNDISDKEIEYIIPLGHYHHEKYNGQGYPDKLKGSEIPLEARIMALADVFDALVSKRCYKDTFSYDKAFSIIQESLGSHFDPKLGKIFIDSREKFEMLYSRI